MDKILVILKREYLQRVRSRAFVIGTFLTPLLILVFSLLPAFLATRAGSVQQVTVLDKSGDPGLFESIKSKMVAQHQAANVKLSLEVPAQNQVLDQAYFQVRAASANSKDGYLVLGPGILDGAVPEYHSKSVGDFVSNAGLETAINQALIERRLARAGISANIDALMKHVELQTEKIGAQGETRENGQTFVIAFVMLFFIYMTILLYGVSTMRGVMEEKQSRIVEVVVSSIKPFNMLMGKLVGIGLAGLTQYLIWVLSALALAKGGMKVLANRGLPIRLPPMLLVYFVVFFLLGFFLYSTLYALVGALVSTEEEAQQMQMPVTMLLVVPMVVFYTIVRDPNSGLSIGLSLFPFFTPTLMMMRIAIASPPLWQVLLSIFLMLVAIVAIVWVASKVYRIAILMYGKKPSLAEVGRWLRYA